VLCLQEAIPLLAADEPVKVTVTTGPIVTEIRQSWSDWAALTTRLYAGSNTLEQVGVCTCHVMSCDVSVCGRGGKGGKGIAMFMCAYGACLVGRGVLQSQLCKKSRRLATDDYHDSLMLCCAVLCCAVLCCVVLQEWTIGPIPVADGIGKEVIVRTTTDLQTGEPHRVTSYGHN